MSPAAGSWPSGAPSVASGRRQRRGLLDAVVIADGERQRELAGEFARLALSSSRAPRRVSPNMMRIGVPVLGLACCAGAVLGLGGGVEVLVSAVPVPSSLFSPALPHAEIEMAASTARTSVWRPRVKRDRRVTKCDVVIAVEVSAGGVAAVDGQRDADDQARSGAAQP
jgi:hypothetical protein